MLERRQEVSEVRTWSTGRCLSRWPLSCPSSFSYFKTPDSFWQKVWNLANRNETRTASRVANQRTKSDKLRTIILRAWYPPPPLSTILFSDRLALASYLISLPFQDLTEWWCVWGPDPVRLDPQPIIRDLWPGPNSKNITPFAINKGDGVICLLPVTRGRMEPNIVGISAASRRNYTANAPTMGRARAAREHGFNSILEKLLHYWRLLKSGHLRVNCAVSVCLSVCLPVCLSVCMYVCLICLVFTDGSTFSLTNTHDWLAQKVTYSVPSGANYLAFGGKLLSLVNILSC